MAIRIYLYIIVVLCFATLLSFGQKINLQKFSVKDGLCQSTVKQIEQDDFGNLWLATNYGLSKFNGKSFETYSTTDGLPSNDITCLLYKNENIFIGTRKGFCSFNGGKIENTALFHKIEGNVRKILEKNNVLHIITNRGYYVLDISKNIFHLDSIAIQNVISQNPTDAEFAEAFEQRPGRPPGAGPDLDAGAVQPAAPSQRVEQRRLRLTGRGALVPARRHRVEQLGDLRLALGGPPTGLEGDRKSVM